MKFSETHEWIAVTGNMGTIGISTHAQRELGDVVYVELPEVGKKVKAGEEVAVLESTKAAADVYSPVSGTIQEVNLQLKDFPELVNSSPENDGWILKISVDTPAELDKLKDDSAYQAQFK